MERDTQPLDTWMREAAESIYKNLRGYFLQFGLEEEKRPPIDDIAFDIQTAYEGKKK